MNVLRPLVLLTGLLLLAIGAGCRVSPESGPATAMPVSGTALARTATATPVATVVALDAIVTSSAATAPPPIAPTAVATVTRDSRQTDASFAAAATDLPASAATAEPSPTLTPLPTYTPPPPPPVIDDEHLILSRPVPADAPQWTDKTYPYGSTRGGTLQPHHGVEFGVPAGTPVLAVASGAVVTAGADDQFVVGPQADFYGNVVVLDHGPSPNGLPLYTVYGHLSEVQVTPGQLVSAGDVLGLSGDSGVAYGPHLHFEVREGTNTYLSTRNPLLWLRPFPAVGVVAGRVTHANGELAHEVPVTLRRVDGQAPYTATTSYAQAPVNADTDLDENFALDDVEPGYYEVIAGANSATTTQPLWVYPGRVNFITLALP